MAMMSDWDVTRDIDRRIAALQSAMEVRNISHVSELRLLRQEIGFHLREVRHRLTSIEKQLERPSTTDWITESLKSLGAKLWFKVAVLAALGASNKELLELVAASFGK